jgi:hypothetical protein
MVMVMDVKLMYALLVMDVMAMDPHDYDYNIHIWLGYKVSIEDFKDNNSDW